MMHILSRIRHAFAALMAMVMPMLAIHAQINTDQVMRVGQNALYFDDYMVAIQYFNQVIEAKPYLEKPYFLRAVAKIHLGDYAGAETDATLALDRNEWLNSAYEVRGVARQNLGRDRDAIADYTRYLATDPDSRNVLYNKASAQLNIGDLAGADSTLTLLLRRHPRYDGAYQALARLHLEQGDTLAALDDASQAISFNANAPNAYIIRAQVLMARGAAADSILENLDMAVKLLPQSAGLYINRAITRYRADDYTGAMADYDYALSLEPDNIIALYNRAMLRTEVHDYNNAITDFSAVLARHPNQYRALFNRANLYRETGALDEAYVDLCAVIDAFPTFAAAYYLRGEVQYNRGRRAAAEADFNKSIALAKRRVEMLPDSDLGETSRSDTADIFSESQEEVAERFASLIEVGDLSATTPSRYSGSTRGQIQDTDFTIALEPLYTLSYHPMTSELKMSADYVKEVDELNASGVLPYTLHATCHEESGDSEIFNRHTTSVDYYTSYFATHSPLAIDYFARAMDFMTLHDYTRAIADLDRAIAASPEFTLALLMRTVARWNSLISDEANGSAAGREGAIMHRAAVNSVLDDIDRVIALSPTMAIAYYNKGVISATEKDLAAAMEAFDRAIELNPSMGEAYYNRGYVLMLLGDKARAFDDLSHAGQLGIAPSYNLIKRMTR